MSTETIRLIRDGEKGGKGVWRWGEREIINLLLHCCHQNDKTEKNKKGDRKGESNDSHEIPNKGEPSDIPGLPSGILF